METELYSITDMSKVLGVNRSSVFRIIKKQNIAPATTKGNKNLYSATVLHQLRKHFSTDDKAKQSPTNELITMLQQQINDLNKELREEKTRADKQLAEKDKQIKVYQKLLDQNQQLLLNEQNKELPSSVKAENESNSSSKPHTERTATWTLEAQSNSNAKAKHWWSKLFSN